MKLGTCKYLDFHNNKKENYGFHFIDINRTKHTKFNCLSQLHENIKIDFCNLLQSQTIIIQITSSKQNTTQGAGGGGGNGDFR